jgi:hypothetical protein
MAEKYCVVEFHHVTFEHSFTEKKKRLEGLIENILDMEDLGEVSGAVHSFGRIMVFYYSKDPRRSQRLLEDELEKADLGFIAMYYTI